MFSGMEKHHLYDCFCRGYVVIQPPLLRHADGAHAIEPNIVSKLGIENIGAQLFLPALYNAG